MGEICSKCCPFLKGDEPGSPRPQEEMGMQLMSAPVAVSMPAAHAMPVSAASSACAPAVYRGAGDGCLAVGQDARTVALQRQMPMATATAAPMGMMGQPGMMPVAAATPVSMGMMGQQGMHMVAATSPMQQGPPMQMATASAVPMGGMVQQGMLPMATATPAVMTQQGPLPMAQATPVVGAVSSQVRTKLPGKRRSLLVGINYYGTSSELSGCVADVKRIGPVLARMGFPADGANQMVLLDEPGMPASQQPTLSNMRAAIRWLTEGVQTGDALFFHYSGHGGRQESYEGADGFVETLCPVDCDTEGMLEDTELFETLVRPLPSGSRLTCLMDCCHSGGVLNLPYIFTGTEANLKQAMSGQAVQMAMSKNWLADIAAWDHGNPAYLLQDVASMGLGLWSLWGQYKASKGANQAGFCADEAKNIGRSVGEVIAITGCRSDQTSADVGNVYDQFQLSRSGARSGRGSFLGNAGGALTAVFIETLEDHCAGNFTYLDLLERIRTRLVQENFDQVPQLATTLLIELQQPFALDMISLPADLSKAASAPQGQGVSTGLTSSGMRSGSPGATTGSAAVLAGFMSTIASAPSGTSMLQGATTRDGSTPYAGMSEGLAAGIGFDELFQALTSNDNDDNISSGLLQHFGQDNMNMFPEFGNEFLQERDGEEDSYGRSMVETVTFRTESEDGSEEEQDEDDDDMDDDDDIDDDDF